MADKPKFWISVTSGMSGWFAVMLVEEDGFVEPQQTGIGRYKTKTEAEKEARQWAEAEELEFRE